MERVWDVKKTIKVPKYFGFSDIVSVSAELVREAKEYAHKDVNFEWRDIKALSAKWEMLKQFMGMCVTF